MTRRRSSNTGRHVRPLAGALTFALLLGACAGADDEEPDESAVTEDVGAEEEPEEEPAEEPDEDMDEEEPAEPAEPEEPEGDAADAEAAAEERGIYLLSEFFQVFPEHEERHEALLAQLQEPAEPIEMEIEEPIQIAFFLPSQEVSDAWARLEGGLEGRLQEMEIPYEITSFLTQVDQHSVQASQVETVLANPDEYDYAIFAPTEWEAQKSHLSRLAAEIPTFVFNVANPFYDTWGTEEAALSHVSFDHEFGALLLCDWAVEETGGEGKVALMRFVRGFVDELRSDTFGDCVEENSDMEVVIDQETDGDSEKAFTGANTVLSAYPDLTFMHAASTSIALGAAAALDERGATDDVIINGWGGGADELAALNEGLLDVVVFRVQDDWGVAGADMIRMHLEGREDEIPGVVSPGMMIIDHTWTPEEIEEQTDFAFRYSGDIDRG